MRQPRVVKHQRTKVVQVNKDYSGERSPYWDWCHNNLQHNQEGEMQEPDQANPDNLSTDDRQPFARESGISVGDISRQLSGQQKKIFEMYVQEGKSEADIAIILKIKHTTVRTHLQRIRERFKFYV